MSSPRFTVLAAALAAGFVSGAQAQTTADLLAELQALKARIAELEKKVAEPAMAPTPPQWGMTPEQVQDFNRIAVKTEALEDNTEAAGFKGLKINGVIDPTYIVNKNQRTSSFSFLNNFAGGSEVFAYDNSYFGMAVIDFQKELEGGTRWRLTLAPHKSVGSNYNYPSIVQEASVSIPVSDLATRAWAGQIPDWSGYEYYFANQTKLITHNLMFDFLAPTYYSAVGTDVTIDKWQIKTALGNMNSSRNNPDADGRSLREPVLSARVDYSKGEFNGFGGALQYGKASSANGGYSTLLNGEIDGYFTRGDLNLQGQINYGTQKDAAFNGGNSSWIGLSALASYKLTPRLEAVSRLDYIDNHKNGGGTFNIAFACDTAGVCTPDGRNGFGPGMVQTDSGWAVADPDQGANRTALSLGVNYALTQNATLKAEYRYDRASLAVFQVLPDGSWRKDNHLFGTSVVVSF